MFKLSSPLFLSARHESFPVTGLSKTNLLVTIFLNSSVNNFFKTSKIVGMIDRWQNESKGFMLRFGGRAQKNVRCLFPRSRKNVTQRVLFYVRRTQVPGARRYQFSGKSRELVKSNGGRR